MPSRLQWLGDKQPAATMPKRLREDFVAAGRMAIGAQLRAYFEQYPADPPSSRLAITLNEFKSLDDTSEQEKWRSLYDADE
jgi:hypothetical protein